MRPRVWLLRQDPSLLTYALFCRLLKEARLMRGDLLHGMGELAWCAAELTGRSAAAEEIARAICDVCAGFP